MTDRELELMAEKYANKIVDLALQSKEKEITLTRENEQLKNENSKYMTEIKQITNLNELANRANDKYIKINNQHTSEIQQLKKTAKSSEEHIQDLTKIIKRLHTLINGICKRTNLEYMDFETEIFEDAFISSGLHHIDFPPE